MTLRKRKFIDWLLLLACNLMWASQFVMVKLVQEQMGPLFAVTFPIALSTILLIFLVAREPKMVATREDVRDFILLGILGQLVAQLFITWGVRIAPASNAALLALVMPVSTAVMAHFLLGEHMNTIRWISFGLALLGVLACSGVDWQNLDFGRGYLAGNMLIFLSVLGSAFYNTYSKKVLERHTPLRVLLYSYYALLTVLLPVTIAVEPSGFPEPGALFEDGLGGACHSRGLPVLPLHGDLSQRAHPARCHTGGAVELSHPVLRRAHRRGRAARALNGIHDHRRSARPGEYAVSDGLGCGDELRSPQAGSR